jgi:tetratricopeptide (TPR) repeat protein
MHLGKKVTADPSIIMKKQDSSSNFVERLLSWGSSRSLNSKTELNSSSRQFDKEEKEQPPSEVKVINETRSDEASVPTKGSFARSPPSPQREPTINVQPVDSKSCMRLALGFVDQGLWNRALEMAQEGLSLLPLSLFHDPHDHDISRRRLWEIQGHALGSLGEYEESLDVYQYIIAHDSLHPSECADLLYSCGRLCVRLRNFQQAAAFYLEELDITVLWLGSENIAVARIYHELARLNKHGMFDPTAALSNLQQALSIELIAFKRIQQDMIECGCGTLCHHRTLLRETAQQIRETKIQIGRIYFEQGDMERAFSSELV